MLESVKPKGDDFLSYSFTLKISNNMGNYNSDSEWNEITQEKDLLRESSQKLDQRVFDYINAERKRISELQSILHKREKELKEHIIQDFTSYLDQTDIIPEGYSLRFTRISFSSTNGFTIQSGQIQKTGRKARPLHDDFKSDLEEVCRDYGNPAVRKVIPPTMNVKR